MLQGEEWRELGSGVEGGGNQQRREWREIGGGVEGDRGKGGGR